MANAREISLRILMKIEENNAFSNILLKNELDKNNEISVLDKKFITQIVYGVVSNKITLDYIIRKCSKVRFNKINLPILTLLRMGIFQIYYLYKIPASAVCNESVKLAKKYGHVSSANFVNAILRNVSRTEKDEFFKDIKDETERLSVFYSYPLWIVELWIRQFGLVETENLIKANSKEFNDSIRVNTLKTNKDDMLKRFNGATLGKLPDIIYAYDTSEVLNSDEFKNGLVTFQDEAPALVAHLLKARVGDEILDICAAPGGKTTHVAELTSDKAKITAMDLYENRCKLIEDTAKRLGISSINVKVSDATLFIPEFNNKFDRIIADVPCSGLGVIRKKPDIKFNISKEDIDSINVIQKKILQNAAKYLKSGGILVYSTCTNVFKENSETIRWFLSENPDFKICTDESLIPNEWKSGLENGMLSLLTSKHDCDGFFICALTKN